MRAPAAYLRVSSREQVEGYSLDAQERAVRDFCATRGWPAPALYVEPGRSAASEETSKRPAFGALLDAATGGAHDVVIVHKLDRFARRVLVTLRELGRLERAGVAFVSVAEQMDFSTPIGRVMLATLAAFAQYYSDNLSTEVKKGLREKEAQGSHIGGIPYGALRVEGRLIIDPARAETLAAILELSRDLAPVRVAQALNRRGIRAPRGGDWWPETIRSIVRNGHWLTAQPDPWPERWRLAAARPPLPRFAQPDPVARPLSGLMRCSCGGAMQYQRNWVRVDGSVAHTVRCRRRMDRGDTAPCPGGRKASAEHYEAIARDWFFAQADLARSRTVPPPDGAAARADIAARRRSLVLALAEGLPEGEYRTRRAALDREEAMLPPPGGQVVALLTEIAIARDRWDELEPADVNALYRLLIARIIISGRCAEVVPSDAFAALLRA